MIFISVIESQRKQCAREYIFYKKFYQYKTNTQNGSKSTKLFYNDYYSFVKPLDAIKTLV